MGNFRLRPLQRSHFNRCLVITALILLWGLGGYERPRLAHSQELEAVSARLDALEKAIQAQKQKFQRQSTILSEILDNVGPARMPEGWENRLAQLQDRARDDERWPRDAVQAKDFLGQTTRLVSELTVRAETQYLQQLSVVRWAAMAFVGLNSPLDARQPPQQFEQLADELSALADAGPEGGTEALVTRLRKRANELAGVAAKQRVAQAIEEANRYLKGTSGETDDMETLHDYLRLYEEDRETLGIDVDIRTLRKTLYKEILRRQAPKQAVAVYDQWRTAQGLAKKSQPADYEAAARMLLQQVISLRAALVLQGVAATQHYDGLEDELRGAVKKIDVERAERAEARHARDVRSYQRWALDEIKTFEGEFQRIVDKAVESNKWLDKGREWMGKVIPFSQDDPDYLKNMHFVQEGQYREVAQAMIVCLLPIDRALLELPVLKRYTQEFEEGWKKLKGRDEQTDVAEASVTVEKKSLREFLEDGS